jgi:hypothetical protein
MKIPKNFHKNLRQLRSRNMKENRVNSGPSFRLHKRTEKNMD